MACVFPCLVLAGAGVGCLGWCCHRAVLQGNQQSEGWQEAQVEEVDDFGRTSLLVLAAYEEDLSNPSREFPEEGRELIRRVQVVKKASYCETQDRCPPYIIVVDHEAKDVCVAVRGLNLARVSEYMTLLDNRKGKQRFTDGYVHHGMLRSAGHLLDDEIDRINALMLAHKDYTLTLAGHSLGSGVVCLMALVILRNLGELSGISKDRMRCHCFAPARCVSLNLAVSSSDVVNSIILQDDFLPRMNYPLETIFGFYVCLPCVLQWACCVDFFYPSTKLINDPRRLYPPGRLYHILYTEGGKCIVAEMPPDARVAVPVDGRFEKLILSRTTHWDHLLTSIYAKLRGLMQAMSAKEEEWKEAPAAQKMQRMETLRRDRVEDTVHALERAQSLKVPNAVDPGPVLRAEEERDELASREQGVSRREETGSGAETEGKDFQERDAAATSAAAAAAAAATVATAAGGEGTSPVAAAGAAATTAAAAAAVSLAGRDAAKASDGGVLRPQEGQAAANAASPAGTMPASDSTATRESRAADAPRPESLRPDAARGPRQAVIGKWSRLIDDLITQENAKAGKGEEREEEEAAVHGVAPRVQKMMRRWSLVRRAVNEGELEERKEEKREKGQDKAGGLPSVPEEAPGLSSVS